MVKMEEKVKVVFEFGFQIKLGKKKGKSQKISLKFNFSKINSLHFFPRGVF